MLDLYKNIKLKRNELGLTQSELAKMMGYADKSMIAKIEKGLVDLSQSKIVEFANALRTTPSQLMGWEDDPITQHDIDEMESVFRKFGVTVNRFTDRRLGEFYQTVSYDGKDYGEIADDLVRLYDELSQNNLSDEDIIDELEYFFSKKKSYGPAPKVRNLLKPRKTKFPLLGSIAAGKPILAESNIEEYIDVEDYVNADFCLKIEGDSMIEANINHGDIVFIKEQSDVDDGQIAAVIIEDSDTYDAKATLKRVHKTENGMYLVSANGKYPPMIYPYDQVRIIGLATHCISRIK